MKKLLIKLVNTILLMSFTLLNGEENQPNIILLFADDAGYSDFGFQGSPNFQTPNLDKLASESVRFTQAYTTSAVCGPSRAGLMTGRYQQKFGYEENNVPSYMSPVGLTGPDMGLPLDQKTIADYLKKAGYKNIFLGKWHLGGADRYHPLKRGFDEFYGFRGGARNYWPYQEPPKDPLRKWERNFKQFVEPEGYLTDVIANEAVKSIERNKENPFFLFVSFNAPHTPMHFLEDDLPDKDIRLTDKRRQLYAMMKSMDRACGKILDKLERLGLTENTLIIFTNDNGGAWINDSNNRPLSGVKFTHLEGGIRVPFLLKYGNQFKASTTFDYPISTFDLLPTFAEIAGLSEEGMEHIDGVSLIPFLNGKNNFRPHKTLYWKNDAQAAIRDGDWKLIRMPDRPALLFNIAKDPYEKKDLAKRYPKKVEKLYKKLFAWETTLKRSLWVTRREIIQMGIEAFDKYRN